MKKSLPVALCALTTPALAGSQREIQRENLERVMAAHYPGPVTAAEPDELTTARDRLDPWPDTVAGLRRLTGRAIIAPMSNGNFIDMVNLTRYASLPWDIIMRRGWACRLRSRRGRMNSAGG